MHSQYICQILHFLPIISARNHCWSFICILILLYVYLEKTYANVDTLSFSKSPFPDVVILSEIILIRIVKLVAKFSYQPSLQYDSSSPAETFLSKPQEGEMNCGYLVLLLITGFYSWVFNSTSSLSGIQSGLITKQWILIKCT